MRIALSTLVLCLFAACGAEEAGVQSPTELVREVATGIRAQSRVEMSVKASAEEATPEDLELRKRLEDRIEGENIGRLISSGAAAGYLTITVEVSNTAEAIPRLQDLLRSEQVDRDAKFKVIPPSE